MLYDSLDLNDSQDEIFEKSKNTKELIKVDLKIEGYNEDITEAYHWHLNFPYYTGKGITPIKLEDYHYYSETSQFGAGMRQIKGGSIKAFEENLQQLVQLIKVHLIPLLQEVKQADFYKKWMDKIVENDKLIQNEIKKNGETEKNKEKLTKWRNERNEAISNIKDKWVTEVDNSRLWQINKSSTENGLDFSLLPQLFFGVNLDDPFQMRSTLKEQLDKEIYPVDITEDAKRVVAQFMYRFYTWLPTAIRDTRMTYRLKITALKQFYAQVQMYIGFMKPLLVEISKKSEGFEKTNFYRKFDAENPEFSSLFDFSYSFVRILGVRNFAKMNRGKWELEDLEFTKFGLYLRTGSEIKFGSMKGKKGFLRKQIKDEYEFFPSDKKNITEEEFKKIEMVMIRKDDLMLYPILEFEFSQRRRQETMKTQQGLQQVPYMSNRILYTAYSWNIYEVATYRAKLKDDNLKLLETFIEEVKVIKKDLLYYVNELEFDKKLYDFDEKNDDNGKKKTKNSNDYTLIVGPFKALGSLFSVFLLNSNNSKTTKKIKMSSEKEKHRLVVKLQSAEDLWKVYSVFKKSHGYIMY